MKKILLFILFLIGSTSLVSAQYSINGEVVRSKIIDSKTFYVEYLYEGKTFYYINGIEYSGEIKNLYFTNDLWYFDREDPQKGVYSTVINGIEYFRDRQSIVFSPDSKHFGYIYKDSFYIDGVNTNIESKYGYDTLVIDNLGNYLLKKGTVGSATTISLLGKSYNVLKSDFLLASIQEGKLIYLFSTSEGDTIFNGDSKGKLGSLMSGVVSEDGKNIISTYRDNLENQKIYINFKLVGSYSNIQAMIVDNIGTYKLIYAFRDNNKLVYKYKDNTQEVILKQVDSFSYSKCIQKGMIYSLINGILYLDNKQVKELVTFLGDSSQGCYYTDSKGNYTLESTKYGTIQNLSYNGDYFYSSFLGKLYSNGLEYNVGQSLSNLVLNGDKFYIQSNDKINISGTIYSLQITNKITVSEGGLLAGYLEGKTYIIKSLSSIIKVGDSKSISGLFIEQTKDDTVTGESGEDPNFEVISRENKLNKASLDKTINTNQLIVNKIEINGYQGYPYTEKQPLYEKMNETNSYIINYKLPKGYNLLSVDAGKDFIVKLDKLNNRYYITPTNERVLREIYLDNNEYYTIRYYYQQGVNKSKKIEIKGNIKYVYGFNFKRDAFSFSNSESSFSEIKKTLEFITLATSKLTFYKDSKKLTNLDLVQITKGTDLIGISVFDGKKYESALKYGSGTFATFLDSKFSGYCQGFVNNGLNLSSKIYSLSGYEKKTINSLFVLSENKVENDIKLGTKIGSDWLKPVFLNNLGREQYDFSSRSFLKGLGLKTKNGGHSVLGYKKEQYDNLEGYRIDLSYNVFYDKNKDGLFLQEECLSRNKSSCLNKELQKLKSVERIYVYDNSVPQDHLSSIFIIETLTGSKIWKLSSFDDYTGDMNSIFNLFFN